MERIASKTLGAPSGLCNPSGAYCYFDKIAFRVERRPNKKAIRFLRENAKFVDCRFGKPIRGANSKRVQILTVVNPNRKGLQFLADKLDLLVNHVEVAMDLTFPDERSKLQARALFDRCFVQPWHRTSETTVFKTTTYTRKRKPGRIFVWYSDRPAKSNHEAHCLHVECRYAGAVAVRRLGIHQPNDLIGFDHRAYWQKNLNLFEIDFTDLGRLHRNRMTGRRLQKPFIVQCGSFRFNVDRRIGGTLYRSLARHATYEHHCVQRFVDRYGRGSWLRRIDPTHIIDIYTQHESYLVPKQYQTDNPQSQPFVPNPATWVGEAKTTWKNNGLSENHQVIPVSPVVPVHSHPPATPIPVSNSKRLNTELGHGGP